MTTTQAATALDTIAEARAAVRAAEETIAAEVCVARANGATWREIGDALGTTRQNAEKRYGSNAPIWT